MISNQRAALSFNAFAHPRRLRIVQVLAAQPKHRASFGTLSDLTKIKQAALAHHIAVMEKGGLISRRFKGTSTILELHLSQASLPIHATLARAPVAKAA